MSWKNSGLFSTVVAVIQPHLASRWIGLKGTKFFIRAQMRYSDVTGYLLQIEGAALLSVTDASFLLLHKLWQCHFILGLLWAVDKVLYENDLMLKGDKWHQSNGKVGLCNEFQGFLEMKSTPAGEGEAWDLVSCYLGFSVSSPWQLLDKKKTTQQQINTLVKVFHSS